MRYSASKDDRFGSEFTRLLQQFRDKCGRTNAEIRRLSGIDEAYISRLFSGDRTRPSRDVIIRLAAFGMGLDMYDTDALLEAAEYRPLVVWHPFNEQAREQVTVNN